MRFVRCSDGNYYEYSSEDQRLYNIEGGWQSSEDVTILEEFEFDSWNSLYQYTAYNPLKGERLWSTGWISPQGDFYPCEAHECAAQSIVTLLTSKSPKYYSDFLIQCGWKRVTTSVMFDYYRSQPEYFDMTKDPRKTFDEWYAVYALRIVHN